MNINYELANYKYDMERCVGCKGCVWVDHIYMPNVRFGIRCPSNIYEIFDAYSSLGRAKIGLGVLEGRLGFSQKLLDVIYKCNLCGACDAGCKRNLDLEPLSILESLRAKCVAEGNGPLPEHKRVAEQIIKTGNRFGAPRQNRLEWMPDGMVSSKADFVYFPGCAASYIDRDIAKATVNILKIAGRKFATLGDQDICCGHPLVDVGLIDQAKKVAEANIQALKKVGAKMIITSCAECYKTWKVDYPKLFGKSTRDMDYKVVHLSELVDELLERGVIHFSKDVRMKVTWHDPCHLGRLSEPWVHWEGEHGKWGLINYPKEYRRGAFGIYFAPRNILNRIEGLEVVEMPRTRENTLCCGAGGGAREAFKEYAHYIGKERLEEAESISVEAIVSGCPYCKENFQKAGDGKGLKIYDLSEIILMGLQ